MPPEGTADSARRGPERLGLGLDRAPVEGAALRVVEFRVERFEMALEVRGRFGLEALVLGDRGDEGDRGRRLLARVLQRDEVAAARALHLRDIANVALEHAPIVELLGPDEEVDFQRRQLAFERRERILRPGRGRRIAARIAILAAVARHASAVLSAAG